VARLARIRGAWPLVALVALVLVATGLASLGGASQDQIVLTALINLLFVVALYVFVGLSGVLSFGHMSFGAIGAFTAAILVIPADVKQSLFFGMPNVLVRAHASPLVSVLAGGVVAAVFALVVGVPLLRLRGLAASLATFALLLIVNNVATNWSSVTGGASGVSAVPTTTSITQVMVWVLVAIVVAFAFQESSWGLRLRASREDEVAARGAGISVVKARTIGWVISAFFTGVAGALYGEFLGSFNASAFYLSVTFVIMAMLVVGGLTSLAGAVVGSILLSLVAELLRRAEGGVNLGSLHVPGRPGLSELGLALIMILILVLRPRGITGGRELPLPAARKRK
jgi:branched-chain amino acid transport system permease protein